MGDIETQPDDIQEISTAGNTPIQRILQAIAKLGNFRFLAALATSLTHGNLNVVDHKIRVFNATSPR